MREVIERIAATEPARVRAVVAAVVGLLAALGVSVSSNITGAVEGVLIGVLTLLPLLLGESIRRKVSPAIEIPNSVEALEIELPEEEDL